MAFLLSHAQRPHAAQVMGQRRGGGLAWRKGCGGDVVVAVLLCAAREGTSSIHLYGTYDIQNIYVYNTVNTYMSSIYTEQSLLPSAISLVSLRLDASCKLGSTTGDRRHGDPNWHFRLQN